MAKKQKQLRIGIIGAGMYACTAHMPVFQKYDNVKVAAVCRKHKHRLREFCKMFNISKGYIDCDEMLEKEKLDGVLVASPHYYHHEHVMACLERNLPVLVEKPMTIKATHARQIVKTSNENDLPVIVGFNRHYWANYCLAKKMIEEEQVGTLRYISARWVGDIDWALARTDPPGYFRQKAFYKDDDPPNFRGDPKLAGGGMFIDGGSHMIDAMLWLTDLKPTSVFARMNNHEYQTDCDTSLSIAFDNTVLASCTVQGATPTFKGHELYITGSKGTIYVDDYTVIYQLNGEKEVRVVDLPGDSCSTANFVHVLMGKDRSHSDAVDGLKTVILIDTAYKSAQKGEPVEIKRWV